MLVSGRQSGRETSGLHSSFQSSQSRTPSPLQPHENVKDLTFCRQNGVALFKLALFPAAFQNTDFCRGPHFLFWVMVLESWPNCCVSPSWPRVSKWNCERHARQKFILAFSPNIAEVPLFIMIVSLTSIWAPFAPFCWQWNSEEILEKMSIPITEHTKTDNSHWDRAWMYGPASLHGLGWWKLQSHIWLYSESFENLWATDQTHTSNSLVMVCMNNTNVVPPPPTHFSAPHIVSRNLLTPGCSI